MPKPATERGTRVGTIVADKYQVVDEIGRGAMGTVYEAINRSIGKHVALKFLEGNVEHDASVRARFLREAQTASLVESPHVVHIFDSGLSDDGTPFMVIELLRGEDLRKRLRREGRLDIEQAVTVITQTLRALVSTHAAGIVHRDLKPENIFLCNVEAAQPFVKILDFGISKVTRPETSLDTLTHQGVVLGTAYYMSPEQARGETDIDGRSDIYAVGAILYEMLTGRTPHVGNVHHAVLVNICTQDAPDVRLLAPQVPEPLARSVARALNRERDQRFRDAQAFLQALDPMLPSRLSTDSVPRVDSATLVAQAAPTRSGVISPSGAAVKRLGSGKLVAGALLLALVLSALSIVIVNRHFKAERKQERTELWKPAAAAESPTRDAAQQPTRKPQDSPAPTSAGTDARYTFPMRGLEHTNANRAYPADNTTSPHHPSARATSSADADLQLKTRMP